MADHKDKAKKIVDRKRKSQDYWQPIYDEFAEVQQAAKCRTTPIYKKGKDGKDTTEIDTTRTNVCMPGISIMIRKNTARMTAQPPQLDFICPDKNVAKKLTSWHYMQYDKTKEAQTRRKTVLQGEMFGIGVEKTFQDNVVIRRQMRVRTKDATRSQLLKKQGLEDKDIEYAVSQMGEQLQPNEVVQALAMHGPEFQIEQEIKRYSGPVQKAIFIGDFYMPPGCDDVDTADWLLEEYIADETFFEYWLKQTYKLDGEDVPVFDQEAVDEMLDGDKDLPDDEKTSLRKKFKELSNLDTTFQYDKETRCSKKFKILECHEKRAGENWIVWVGNESTQLGEMPYPCDLGGAWQYTALVPLPDLVSAIGDSTPRLGRFLHRLHNVNTGQRQDLITNFMKPTVYTRDSADLPDEAFDRGFMREVRVKNPGDINVQQMPNLPQYAWENESAILRQFGMLEPSLMSADSAGTNSNPQSGATATVGVLAQRERDTMLGDKIIGLNIFLKKVGEKKLEMLRNTMQDPVAISAKYFNEETLGELAGQSPEKGISQRSGQPQVITLDWTEIQDDIQVEPKVGSTLSIEDEFIAMKAQAFWQAAAADQSGILNKYYAAKAWADTIPNVDSNVAINPPPPPPDPLASTKISLSMSMPLDKMPADITNQALEKAGFTPSEELKHRDTLDGIVKVGEAADAAGKLAEPAGGVEPGGKEGIRRTAADRVKPALGA